MLASPFDKDKHTADNIAIKLREGMEKCSYAVQEEGMGVFEATSDNDASMVKGMQDVGFGGGDCAPHTVELSANLFYNTAGVKEVARKVKGMTEHFHRIGGANMEALHECQAEYQLARRKPKVGYHPSHDTLDLHWP